MSIVKDMSLAESGRRKIQWVRDFMPALSQIEARFLQESPSRACGWRCPSIWKPRRPTWATS